MKSQIAERGGDRPFRSGARLAPGSALSGRRRSEAVGSCESQRLLERDLFLDEFKAICDETGPRATGAIVVEGPMGSGKTALLNAMCAMARAANWLVLHTSSSDFETGTQFGVVRQLFASLDHLGPTRHGKPVTDGVAVVLGRDRLGQSDDVERIRTFEPLLQVVSGLAERQHVLVAVDDAANVDQESGEWLLRLARRIEPLRVHLLLSFGSRRAGLPLSLVERIVSEPATRVMSLAPLQLDSAVELLTKHFREKPEEPFARVCHELTGGNPFLLVALMKALPPGVARPTSQFVERLHQLAPPAVARMVLTRLASLPVEATLLLEAIAVLGDGIDLQLGALVAGIDPQSGRGIVDRLAAADLLQRDIPLRFLHPVVRSTVYNEIEAGRRAHLHSLAARRLSERAVPLSQIAPHLLSSEPSGDGWSASQLQQVGRSALQQGSADLALRCFNQALAETPEEAHGHTGVLLDLASAEAMLGLPTALQHLRQASGVGDDAAECARVALRLVRSLPPTSILTEAASTLALLAPRLGSSDADLRFEVEVIRALLARSALADLAATAALRPLIDRRRTGRTTAERLALGLLGIVEFSDADGSGADEVAAILDRAIVPDELVTDDPLRVRLWVRALVTLSRAGHFSQADLLLETSERRAGDDGFTLSQAEYALGFAMSLALQGRLEDAAHRARQALQLADGQSWSSTPLAVACLADVSITQGDLAGAATMLETCTKTDLEPSTVEGIAVLEQRGRLRLMQRKPAEALADLLLAGTWAEGARITNPASTCWRAVASAGLAAQGRHEEAVLLAEENLARARSVGAPWVVGSALRVSASVTASCEERLARLREAVAFLDHSGALVELARAQVDLGEALFEAGDVANARDALRWGADVAQHCGGGPLATRATAALRRAGARPRRLVLSGAAALTPAEYRVVTLAIDGQTNAAIASALFVTEKTVEGHLRRSFRKLRVQSRRELRAAILDPDAPPF